MFTHLYVANARYGSAILSGSDNISYKSSDVGIVNNLDTL